MMSIQNHLSLYKGLYNQGINSLDTNELMRAIVAIKAVGVMKKHIYVAGNGGSSAISNHLCCDFMKGTYVDDLNPTRSISLSCNTSLLTAIGNDLGYDETILFQLKNLLQTNDLVILISSSGNSPNIVKAAEYVKSRGEKLIGLTGFKGGKLNELADIKLHIPVDNYGVIEDCHQSIMHMISQYIAKERGL